MARRLRVSSRSRAAGFKGGRGGRTKSSRRRLVEAAVESLTRWMTVSYRCSMPSCCRTAASQLSGDWTYSIEAIVPSMKRRASSEVVASQPGGGSPRKSRTCSFSSSLRSASAWISLGVGDAERAGRGRASPSSSSPGSSWLREASRSVSWARSCAARVTAGAGESAGGQP